MSPWSMFLLVVTLAGPPPVASGDAATPGASEPGPPGLASRARVQAINRMNEAIHAFDRNDATTAESKMREAIQLDPTFADAYLNLGKIYRKLGKNDAAAEVMRSGLALPGLLPATEADLAYDLGAILMETAEAAGKTRDRRARWTEAVTMFDRAIAADPARYKSHFRRAVALDRLDRASEADDAYRRCIALRPNYAPCFVSLGNLYVDYGHENVAMQILELGVKLNPSDARMRAGIARAYFELGRMQDAVAAAQEGLKIDPDAIDLWYALGMAFAELRERKEAVEALSQFLVRAGSETRPDLLKSARDTVARMQDAI